MLLVWAAGRSAYAEEPAAATHPADKVSVTTGTLTVGGKELAYTATAGYMPLKDESGKPRARIFYTAYTAGMRQMPATAPASAPATEPATAPTSENGQDPKRPLIFLFNGGPGAASVWLHLGAVGPMRLDVPEDGSVPKPPYKTVENASSWLTDADLVFVDPVGTGYSRAAEPDKAKEFYGVKEDIESVGEFVRLFLTKNQRWGSPIYLAGESYGTTRVAGLAPYLQERVGVSLNGIILISTVLNFGAISAQPGNDLPYALNLPTYAALAHYHHKAPTKLKLEPFLEDAENFALHEYTVALAKGSALSEEDRKSIARKIANFTGLSDSYVLESNLRIPPNRFQKELLRDQGKIIGRFDGRLTGAPLDPPNDSAEYDPSLSGFYPAYTSAFNDYVRRTLKYDNDLPYEVLSNQTRPWNFASGGANNAFLYVGDDLKAAMTTNPHLKLLVCAGRYDLATPYFGVVYTLNHLQLAKDLQKNITLTFYPGGHMMYHTKDNLEALHKNVANFISEAK
jgi:carboxypeptidase C (cathepsin A)